MCTSQVPHHSLQASTLPPLLLLLRPLRLLLLLPDV
jgi:hypothetical protein